MVQEQVRMREKKTGGGFRDRKLKEGKQRYRRWVG